MNLNLNLGEKHHRSNGFKPQHPERSAQSTNNAAEPDRLSCPTHPETDKQRRNKPLKDRPTTSEDFAVTENLHKGCRHTAKQVQQTETQSRMNPPYNKLPNPSKRGTPPLNAPTPKTELGRTAKERKSTCKQDLAQSCGNYARQTNQTQAAH